MLTDFMNLIKVEAIFLLFQLKQFKRSIHMIYYRHENIKHEQCVCVCVCVCVFVVCL
jgi:hypothetical protein